MKDGFPGEHSVVLSPMVIELEEKDSLVSSLFITDIGYYPHAANHYRIRQTPIDQYVLIYCVDGSGWYRIDQKSYKVQRNQFFILPAGHSHAYGSDAENGWTIYWIHFKGAHAGIYAHGAFVPHDIQITIESRVNDRNNIFDEMLHTLEMSQSIEHLRYASSLLHHYLASMRYLQQFRKADNSNKDDSSIVNAAIHFMRENIEKHITLQDVLSFTGYSASHFSSMFKRQTGCSPLSFFNRMKMERACRLLTNSNLQINQISHKVGIKDSLYFSRLFTKTMGISPKLYRQGKQQQGEKNEGRQ